MAAGDLVARLDAVIETGPGTWRARCPAHRGKSRSLSVREIEDGRTLVKCFASCSVAEVLGAVGLGMDALFPPKPIEHGKRIRPPFPAVDVLRAVAAELGVIAVVAGDVARRREVSEHDYARLRLAIERVQTAKELACGR